MLKVRYSWFCSLLVLISGLISCSKDKDVRLQPDVFAPSELKVERSDRSYQLAENIHKVDLTSKLIVGPARDDDFNDDLKDGPVVFKINSQCTNIQSNQSFTSEYSQINSPELSVLQLIPKEILLLTKNVPIQCDFFLVAENSHRSTYTSSLKNVSVTDIVSFSNMPLNFAVDIGATYETSKSSVLFSPSESTVARLNCDELGSQLVSNQLITLENMVGDQIEKKLNSPVQNCRMLFLSGKQIKLSKVFQLNMPVLPLQISSQVLPLEKLSGNIFQHKALDVTISNPNNSAMKLRINNPSTNQFLFQPAIYNNRTRMLLQSLIKRPITWSSQSAQPLEIFADHLELVINGNETTTLTATVALNINCEGNHSEFEAPGIIVFHAFGFELSEFVQEPYPDTHMMLQIPWQGESHNLASISLNQWIFQFQDAGLLNYGRNDRDKDVNIQELQGPRNICKNI